MVEGRLTPIGWSGISGPDGSKELGLADENDNHESLIAQV